MGQAKILLIDADDTGRNLVAQILLKKGYMVFHAGTGSEGLETARQGMSDLIICDTNLKDMQANELIHQILINPETSHIPCIVLSSKISDEEMRACLEAGCTEYYIRSGPMMLNMFNSLPEIIKEKNL